MKTTAQRKVERQVARFAKQFHSVERVEWIKDLPCEVTGVRSPFDVHNAHMRGRAGPGETYKLIVPLYAQVHGDFDTMPEEKFLATWGRTKDSIRERASHYQTMWEER